MSFPYLPLLNDTLAIQLVAPFYHPGPANELFMNTHTTVIVKHIILQIMMTINNNNNNNNTIVYRVYR